MTSPTSAKARTAAFTLVELLMVVGIILLIIGILIPAVTRALAIAKRTRTAADLSSIATALEQYHSDYGGQFPTLQGANSGAATLGKALMALGPSADPAPAFNANDSYYQFDRVTQASVTYQCKQNNPANPTSQAPTNASFWDAVTDVAPVYNAGTTYQPGSVVSDGLATPKTYVSLVASTGQPLVTSPPSNYWAEFYTSDGAGPGQYRVRRGAAIKNAYLQPERFKVNGTDIVDGNGRPFLFFPARPGLTNITQSLGTAPDNAGDSSTAPRGTYFDQRTVGDNANPKWQPKFDANASLAVFPGSTNAERLRYARVMLGDIHDPAQPTVAVAPNGAIDAGDTAVAGSDFILWAAGEDGLFGPVNLTTKDISACDDVIVSQ